MQIVTLVPNQHIGIISEGSCDWVVAENSALSSQEDFLNILK